MKTAASIFAVLLLTGCAAKRPHNYVFQNCKVEVRSGDHLSCNCGNAKQIGIDAKSGATVLRCN
jgi:hypothetical protein